MRMRRRRKEECSTSFPSALIAFASDEELSAKALALTVQPLSLIELDRRGAVEATDTMVLEIRMKSKRKRK